MKTAEKTLNYLFVYREYPPYIYKIPYGGLTNYLINIIEGMKKRGVNVFVIAPKFTHETFKEKDGVVVERIYMPMPTNFRRNLKNFILQFYHHIIYDFLVMIKIHKLCKRYKIDIIEPSDGHSRMLFYHFWKKIPVIVKLHGPSFFIASLNNRKPRLLSWERFIHFKDKRTIKNADVLLAASVSIRDMICEELKIDKEKVVVIPDPVEETKELKVDLSKRRTKIVLFVSRLEKCKGADIVVKAAKEVLRKRNDTHFIFIGHSTPFNGGSFKEYLEGMLSPQEREKIHFIGAKPKEYLKYFYSISDIVVNHGLGGSYGYTGLEPMENGCCVISTTYGPGKNEHIIEEGEDGFLVNPGDWEALSEKIMYLLDNPKLIREIGRNAREKIHKEYSPERIAERTIEALEPFLHKNT